MCQSDSGTTSLQLKARRHQAEPMVANSIFVCGMSCHDVGTEPAVEPTCRKLGDAAKQMTGDTKLLRKIHSYAGGLQLIILQRRLLLDLQAGDRKGV